MVELISPNGGELSSEFIENKVVGLIAIIVVKNNRMT
jgi:hypothetical protein